MFGFWRKTNRTKKIAAPDIEFVGEQEGANERLLKEKLVVVFSSQRSIKRAYLAQAIYHNSRGGVEVVLALKATDQSDEKIVTSVADAFKEVAPTDVHLDIVFLSETMEQDLSKVCRTFFELIET